MGYDIQVDDDAVDQKPMRKEALTAMFALGSYVTDINEPFTCKLEDVLASFGRQTWLEEAQLLDPTHITAYFVNSLTYVFVVFSTSI